MPAQWHTPESWRPASPADAVPRAAWWTVLHDAALSDLQQRLLASNATLAGAAARYEQAKALTGVALSARFPIVTAGASVSGQRESAETSATFAIPVQASYEVDLFGKRLKNIELAKLSAEAQAADLENVRLVLTADLAANYVTLRRVDVEIRIVQHTLEALGKALSIVQSRHDHGIASGLDVAQEQVLIESTRTQAALLEQTRAGLEHAIAVLVGEPAQTFHVAPLDVDTLPDAPVVALAAPTDVLERRPDVASAERAVAAANARVGLARTAYFPSLTLIASGGFKTDTLAKLFDVPSMVWAVGAALAQDVFTGGRREAEMKFEQAGYDAAVADYRGAVLRACQDVQDSIASLDAINRARLSQRAAVDAAARALEIANNRYTGGLASALDVVTAQQSLLNAQRTLVGLDGNRLIETIGLVKALGGGW